MTPSEKQALRALCDRATPGPWTKGHNPPHREPLEYIAEAYSYGPPGMVHLVCVPFEDKPIDEEAKFTAITGNGPTSEANAAFIAAARSALPELLDECERLEAEVERLKNLAKNIHIMAWENGKRETEIALEADRDALNASEEAFTEIVEMCGLAETWEYPGQVVRDVKDSLTALRSENESLKAALREACDIADRAPALGTTLQASNANRARLASLRQKAGG